MRVKETFSSPALINLYLIFKMTEPIKESRLHFFIFQKLAAAPLMLRWQMFFAGMKTIEKGWRLLMIFFKNLRIQIYIPWSHLYAGTDHFDWSYIEEKYNKTHEIITMFRDPVDRAISHFEYVKLQKWTSDDYKNKNLSDFLANPEEMMNMRNRILEKK